MSELGFSDLTEDEALIVSIYRDWASAPGVKLFFERRIASALFRDRLHHLLETIFAVFREVTPAAEKMPCLGAVLSEDEERLLDMLASRLGNQAASSPIVRPVAEISCSGHDKLLERINEAQWRNALHLSAV